MRNRLFLTLTALSLLAAPLARADSPTPNMLLINPGDLLGGVVSIEYERALASWFGLTAGVSVWAFRGPFIFPGTPAYTAFGPELGARFHFFRDAPGGFWLGPYLSAGYVFSRDTGVLTRPWSWGLGAALGYNFIIGRHFTFQIGAGGGFTDYGDVLVWSPRLRLGIGAAF